MNRWGRIGLLLVIAASVGMSVVARNERATAATARINRRRSESWDGMVADTARRHWISWPDRV